MHTIEIGKGEYIFQGQEIAILSIGTIGNSIIEIKNELPKNKFSLYNMRFVKPLDEDLLHFIFKKYKTIVTIEDGTVIGGFGSAVLEFSSKFGYNNIKIKQLGIPDTFIEHGKNYELFKSIDLSSQKILQLLLKL
jgi:1-deoxy-D-xylulose-5-phosphate synthase